MNLFNCYQAVGFYTAVPFAIQWLYNNGFFTWATILGVAEFVGFVLLAHSVNESK